MVRRLGPSVLIALLTWVGLSSPANASATIDLLWGGTSPTVSSVSSSSLLTLQVVLTAGPNGSYGGSVTIDYTDAMGSLTVAQFTNNPNRNNLYLPFFFEITADTGSRVEHINASCIADHGVCSGISAFERYVLGTITFHLDSLSTGVLTVDPILAETIDGLVDPTGVDISDSTTFNPATIVSGVVPEPATISLFGFGLAGLALAGHRRRDASI